ASDAATRAERGGNRAGRCGAREARGRTRGHRDEPRPARDGSRGALPRGSLLPTTPSAPARAATARARRRLEAGARALPRPHSAAAGVAEDILSTRALDARGLRLAGQRARAAKPRRHGLSHERGTAHRGRALPGGARATL